MESTVDLRPLIELNDKFRFRFDPAILVCLNDAPLRYGTLRDQLDHHTRGRVEDNTLSRGLGRLRRRRLIIAQPTDIGARTVPTYQLTPAGQLDVGLYRALMATYQQHMLERARKAHPGD